MTHRDIWDIYTEIQTYRQRGRQTYIQSDRQGGHTAIQPDSHTYIHTYNTYNTDNTYIHTHKHTYIQKYRETDWLTD